MKKISCKSVKIVTVVVMVILCGGFAAGDHWGYPAPAANGEVNGNENWGGQCEEGMRQSPIDLAYSASVRGFYPQFEFSGYKDTVQNATLENNGHSIEINLANPENIILSGGGLEQEYVFEQMHFHWGSEHTINGRRFALELHMVHYDRRFKSIQDALGVKNGIAVLGVLFHVSAVENEKLEQILNSLGDISRRVGAKAPIDKPFRMVDLLPRQRDSFFRYEGSLTTPSCMEAVVWTVFTQSLPLSLDQLGALKHITSSSGTELLNNYRQVQPLNARSLVYVVADAASDESFDYTNGSAAAAVAGGIKGWSVLCATTTMIWLCSFLGIRIFY